MTEFVVDVTPSQKTLRITGRMTFLDVIQEKSETWAHYKGRQLELPAVRKAVDTLKELFPGDLLAHCTPGAREVIAQINALALIEDETRRAKLEDAVRMDDYVFDGEHPPWDHQVKALMLGCDRRVFGYFMEMGTGKTRVIIDTAAYLFEKGLIELVIVIAPNGVHRQWITDELPQWMPQRIPVRAWAHRPGRKEPEDLYEADETRLRFYTINAESLSVKSGQERLERLLKSAPKGKCLLVIDESSMFKNPQAKRSKFVTKVGQIAGWRRILDGLPISKGVHDIYSQFRFLDPQIIGVSSFTGFRNRYCRMGGFEGKQIVGYRNVAELMERVQGHTYRVRKDDCLDLPRKMPPVTRYVELTPEQLKYYRKMRDNYFIELENGKVLDGTIGAVKVMRLHQIVCGHLPHGDGSGKWDPLPNNRFSAIDSIRQQVDGKRIIWCRWVPDVIQIAERLGECAVEYSGRINHGDREQALYRMREEEGCTDLVAQIQTGGVGLNMTFANNSVYQSNNPSLRLRKQSEDRTHRGGQIRICSYFDIVALIPGPQKDRRGPDGMILDILENDYDLAIKSLDPEYLHQFL